MDLVSGGMRTVATPLASVRAGASRGPSGRAHPLKSGRATVAAGMGRSVTASRTVTAMERSGVAKLGAGAWPRPEEMCPSKASPSAAKKQSLRVGVVLVDAEGMCMLSLDASPRRVGLPREAAVCEQSAWIVDRQIRVWGLESGFTRVS